MREDQHARALVGRPVTYPMRQAGPYERPIASPVSDVAADVALGDLRTPGAATGDRPVRPGPTRRHVSRTNR